MNQHDDSGFFRTFALVLGALVLFTIFIAVIANIYSPKVDRSNDALVQGELARQIAPIGQSRVARDAIAEPADKAMVTESAPTETVATEDSDSTEDSNEMVAEKAAEVVEAEPEARSDAIQAVAAVDAETTTVTDASEVPLRVKAVVATNCAGCHRDGLNGAQRSDDKEAWQALEAQGLETLVASVINGKGTMPPRAETTLSDEEISQAVQYMIAQAVGDEADTAKADTEQTDRRWRCCGFDCRPRTAGQRRSVRRII